MPSAIFLAFFFAQSLFWGQIRLNPKFPFPRWPWSRTFVWGSLLLLFWGKTKFWGNYKLTFGNLSEEGKSEGKIHLNCFKFVFLGWINTLTSTIVKCDTPELISISLTSKICFKQIPIVPTSSQVEGRLNST